MAALDSEAYLHDRLDDQLIWLSRASRRSKAAFRRLRLLEILLGTGITIFSPYAVKMPWGALAIALAGGGVAVSGSLLAMNRHQENWLRYRSLGEALKREKFLYLARAEPYANEPDAFPRLVINAESLLGQESSVWLSQMNRKAEPPEMPTR